MNKQEQLRYDYIGVGICIAVASVLRNSAGSSPSVTEALCGAGIDMKELNRLKPLLDLDDYEHIIKHLREESKNDRWKLRVDGDNGESGQVFIQNLNDFLRNSDEIDERSNQSVEVNKQFLIDEGYLIEEKFPTKVNTDK